MATKNVQGAAAEAERLEGEAERLAEQLASARQSAREAEREIGTVKARRKEIGLAVFRKDPAAVEELAELRARATSAEETLEVSGGASEQLERRLGEAKDALAGARIGVHREKADELYRQSAALDAEREELGKRLAEVLDRQADLHHDRVQAVRQTGDHDRANSMFVSGNGTRDWLELTFARWLLR
jgi:chromosome segregation ATPase